MKRLMIRAGAALFAVLAISGMAHAADCVPTSPTSSAVASQVELLKKLCEGITISHIGDEVVDTDAIASVQDLVVGSAVASGQFTPAPGPFVVVGCVRDTSGGNMGNQVAKAASCDSKGNGRIAICAADLSTCIEGAIADANLTGPSILPVAGMGNCATDALPPTLTNKRFGNIRVDCSGGQQLVMPWAQKQEWLHKYFVLTDGATSTETLLAAANTSLQRCVTGLTVSWTALSAASPWEIRDGAGGTVLRGGDVTTAAGSTRENVSPPHCGTLNTALYFKLTSAITTGSVRVTFDAVSLKP